MSIRVVVADDQALVRAGFRLLVDSASDLEVVGEAVDGAQAFWLYHQMEPNVVVLDLNMPGANGLEVLTAIRKTDQETVIIMFSADPALALRDACLQAGANFYLDKSELPSLIDICRQLQE